MLCYKRIFLIELVGSLFFLFFHSAEAEPLGFDFFSSPGRVSHYTFLVGLAQVGTYGREFNAAERSFAIENDLPIPSGSYGGLMDKSHDDFRESLTPPFGGGFNENDATQI